MSTPIEIRFPENGLHEAAAFSDQPDLTTDNARNVRFRNRKNDRRCGAKRSGSKRWLPGTISGATKVSRIESVIYARKKMDYAAYADGAHVVEAAINGPALSDCPEICTDSDGNVYFVDGPAGIVKVNPDLVQVWKIAIPLPDKLHSCRALFVDDFGGVYFAISSGGDSEKAKLWKYQQDEDDKTSKLWEIDTGMFVERVVRVDALLYTLQNDPLTRQTFVIAYNRVDGTAPEEEWRTAVSYPGNGLTVSPTDHSVYFASEPNSTRGFNPKSPLTTARLTDWTPKDLYKSKQRIWSWYTCDSLDNFNISNAAGDDPDGNEVLVWYDVTGNGRHWYANAKLAVGTAGTADRGPTYRARSTGDLPALRFSGDGTVANAGQSMWTIAPTSDDRAYRNEQLSALPTYKGAQFVVCMVVRYAITTTNYSLLTVDDLAGANDMGILLNRRPMNAGGAANPYPGTAHPYQVGAVASDAASTTPAAGGPSGQNNTPSHGPIGPFGHALITWVHDGGTHDVFATSTKSQFRVNGNPQDRWQAARRGFLGSCLLGYPFNMGLAAACARFGGELSEMIVLSDWDDESGNLQRLVNTGTGDPATGASNAFPDTNVVASSSNIDGDIERLEGYLAHKYGISHLLPAGFSATLTHNANFGAGATVTVAGQVYTFQAVPAAQFDVDIGATLQASMLNLCSAINGTGEPGVDYYWNNTAHPSIYCLPPVETATANQCMLRFVARNQLAAIFTLASSVGTSSAVLLRQDGAGQNAGWHPHAYSLLHTSENAGGPPAIGVVPGSSKQQDLISVYGILGKLDAGGRLRWAMTSNYQNNATGYGGVGYGCACNAFGEIYSVGPRQALVTTPAVTADAFDYRKVVDTGDGFKAIAAGTALTDTWRAAAAENLYHYPRLAVDKFDNVYIPILDAAETVSLRVFQRQPNGGGTSAGVQVLAVNNLTDDPQGYAVAIDPRVPEYETDLSAISNPIQARAQFAYLATRKETGTNLLVVHKITLVAATPGSGSPRARVDVAASGTALKSFTAGGAYVSLGTPFASTADFIDSTVLFEKAIFTDGLYLFVFDPKLGTIVRLKAKASGQVPHGCQLVSNFNGRVVAARDKSNPHRWYMGEQGVITGWDFGAPQSATKAVSHADPRIGPVPDIINALHKAGEDTFLFGCQNSIWMLLGDPAATNSRLQVVSGSDCGMAFGHSCVRDGEGDQFFVGARGGFYHFANGGPKCLSDETIPRRMRDLDFGSNWIETVWDPRENSIRVYLCPFGAGGSRRLAYTWEKRTGRITPWEDSYGTEALFGVQPTCAKLIEGDTAEERVLLFGTEDGRIMAYDETLNDDDGTPIDAYVDISVTPKIPGKSFFFRRLKIALSQDDGGCNYEFFGSQIAEQLGPVHKMGVLVPGPNPTKLVRVRGRHVTLRLRNAAAGQGFGYEEGSIDAEAFGIARAGL